MNFSIKPRLSRLWPLNFAAIYPPDSMKQTRSLVTCALRLLTLVAAMTVFSGHADEVADVAQLLRSKQFAPALTLADRYLADKPADPQMRFFKGVIQRNLGQQAEAIVTFTQLTEDYPELPEPHNNLAALYAETGQIDKARLALEMAVRTNPNYAIAQENLGDIYARLASQAYAKAGQLDRSNAAVPRKLALIGEIFKPALPGPRPVASTAAAAGSAPLPAAPASQPATATVTPTGNPAVR